MLLVVLDFGLLIEIIQFLMEIDKLKDIQWCIKVIVSLCQENLVEYSWYFVVVVMSLVFYVGLDIDINCVIKMMLLYDIVEIDVGDVIVYDLVVRVVIYE